ncbi:kinase-like protein [Ophiobolus disseminans]|uniref:Kinase-like protein n=1 Tax=Ophiobolus disseminans TaxID=1469910 RepID=A0A6A7ACG8_9PLEO|nr:kinase-like protein [Ophiobolus disseminans]
MDIRFLGIVFAEMLVMLLDEDIEALRIHMRGNKMASVPYHNKRDRFHSWFKSAVPNQPDRGGFSAHGIYEHRIAHMLDTQPNTQPSAKIILRILTNKRPDLLGSRPPCMCTVTDSVHTPETKSGWQVGKEKFLWDSAAQTQLNVTERGVLGQGRTGVVEEVRVPGYSTFLARKRILIRRISAPGAIEKNGIRSEIENLRRLDHVHIVQILGCYQEPAGRYGAYFYVLLYLAADNDLHIFLEETCRTAPIEDRAMYNSWLKSWFICLSSALAYLHYRGVFHEDIKPANIIHCGDKIYLTDFSSSRRIQKWDETSTESPAAATRLFAAPEALYEGGAMQRHGSKTDVFSLGLVFVEMLTVMYGEQVDDLREFVFKDAEGQHQYHRVSTEIADWVFKGAASHGRKFYGIASLILSRMLALEREKRSSAQEIVDVFLQLGDEYGSKECGCQWYNWTRPETINMSPGNVQVDEDGDFVMDAIKRMAVH